MDHFGQQLHNNIDDPYCLSRAGEKYRREEEHDQFCGSDDASAREKGVYKFKTRIAHVTIPAGANYSRKRLPLEDDGLNDTDEDASKQDWQKMIAQLEPVQKEARAVMSKAANRKIWGLMMLSPT